MCPQAVQADDLPNEWVLDRLDHQIDLDFPVLCAIVLSHLLQQLN